MKHLWTLAAALVLGGHMAANAAANPAPNATAAGAAKPARPAVAAHAQQDILRHRAMAAAHEAAARCLEAGKPEASCHAELQVSCQGLALGKLCGMRHEH